MSTDTLTHVPRSGQPQRAECGLYVRDWPTGDHEFLRQQAERHRLAADSEGLGYCQQCIAALRRQETARRKLRQMDTERERRYHAHAWAQTPSVGQPATYAHVVFRCPCGATKTVCLGPAQACEGFHGIDVSATD